LYIACGVGLGTDAANAFSKVYVLAITSTLKGFFDAAVDVADPGVDVDDDFAVEGDGEVFGLFEGRVLRTNGDG
jgi:hypothetical protein